MCQYANMQICELGACRRQALGNIAKDAKPPSAERRERKGLFNICESCYNKISLFETIHSAGRVTNSHIGILAH